jgi:hypothetical protein
MGYFTSLFNTTAYPLLEAAFAIDLVVYPLSRKSKDIEEIQIKGLLYDPSTNKQIVLEDQYKNEMTTMAVRIHRETAETAGLTSITLRDAQIEIFGIKYLVTNVSNSDEIFWIIRLEKVEPKEIMDRGRRD